ncbi:LCP family protein [Facklamia sp. 7083-14-GEN3]|uniref:LCP family protein n=1 Tax=Facklamia sp. 7083-14-GEN3 TaxID=2973478 RepID=UPI00215D3052|nr:LCP family protein [Facklamia sp. 7083-14-GEN3]MCR8968906.1 LCP family protein [Facklamia sp. 7083-14-GEN3]
MIKKLFKYIVVFALLITSLFTMTVSTHATDVNKPFSVLLLGIDTGDLGRTEVGRSDVMMVATINPEEENIVVTSIPRDSYVDIPNRGMDKINHAYAFGGPELSVETVENWLDIKIPYYVTVDMKGLADVVDSVGGIDVVPPTTFEISGYTFTEGQEVHLDGEMALAYVRERYNSGGDYARQKRQRQVVFGIAQAALNKTRGIKEVIGMTTAINKYVGMNLNMFDLGKLVVSHLDMRPTISFNQFEGEGFMLDGIYYDQITEESFSKNQQIIKDELSGKLTNDPENEDTFKLEKESDK